jgi:2-dehydro-3-deoxygluconokinase
VNDSEAEMLTGTAVPSEAARIFRDHGAKHVVIKMGPQGCIVFDDGGEQRVPGFSVVARDTTGAGDCFVGAFLAAMQRGQTYAQAARVANAAGAMNVEQIGAAKGVRSWDETEAWIRERDTL